MRALLPLVLVDLLLFTATGVAVVAWVPMPWRGWLLPGSPAVGAAALLVALHITSLAVGVRMGTVVILVAAIATLAVRSSRCRWWRQVERASWMLGIAALIAGAFCLTFVSKPFRAEGVTVVGTANDAFYYVSLTDWLLDHPALSTRTAGVDPPAFALTRQTLHQGLRLGEEMDEGAVATITANDPVNTFSTTTLMWLFFIPGACIAAFEVLRLGRIAGVAAGVLAGGSAVVAVQVLTQNASGLLGIAIAPVAIALWARYVAPSFQRRREQAGPASQAAPAPASARPPLWLVAIVLDGFVGAYTEYLPIVGVGMLVFAALRPPREWMSTAREVLKLAGVAIAIGPLIWYNAVRSLLLTFSLNGATGTAPNSPFLNVPAPTWIARITGVSSYTASTHHTLGFILAAWLIGGVVLAMVWSPQRGLFACILVNFVVVTLLLGSRYHYFSYGEYRAVGTGLSLVVLAAVAGWAACIERLRRSEASARAAVGLAVAAAAGGAGLLLVANQRNIAGQASQDWSGRRVTGDFANSAAWVASVGDHRGSQVTALLPDYFTELWSLYTLRSVPEINFPFVYSDYAAVPPLAYDDSRLRRYVLLGGALFSTLDPSAVVHADSRFMYLDTSRGSVMLALGVLNAQPIELTPQHTVQQWLGNDGRLLVAHTPDVHAVTLTLRANPALTGVPVTISADGNPGRDYLVGQADVTVTVPLGSPTLSVVEVDNHVPAVAPSAADLRPLSVLVEAVRTA